MGGSNSKDNEKFELDLGVDESRTKAISKEELDDKENEGLFVNYKFTKKSGKVKVVRIPKSVLTSGIINLWNEGCTGKGMKVGIVDSGVDPNHPDLNVVTSKTVVGDPDMFAGMHGTHVAGIVAANGEIVGHAPHAEICSIQVFDVSGSSSNSTIAEGSRLARILGCRGMNLSLGSPAPSPAIKRELDEARDQGIIIFAAAGNEGERIDWGGRIYSYPASEEGVISVGAVELSYDPITIESLMFSNRNEKVDLCSDGGNVLSTFPNSRYGILSGTSMSTPAVTGNAMCILQKIEKIEDFPNVTISQEAMVLFFVRSVDVNHRDRGRDFLTGYGLSSTTTDLTKRYAIAQAVELAKRCSNIEF